MICESVSPITPTPAGPRRVAKIRALDSLNFRGKIGFFSQNLALSCAIAKQVFLLGNRNRAEQSAFFTTFFFPPSMFRGERSSSPWSCPRLASGANYFFSLSSPLGRLGFCEADEIRERKKLREKFLRVFSASRGGCDGPGPPRLPVSKPEIGRGKRSDRSGGSSDVSAGGFLLISPEPRPAAPLDYCDSEEFHEQDYMVLVRIQTHY